MPPVKPLGCKAYSHIPHLPGSQKNAGSDYGYDEKAARFFLNYAGKDSVIWLLRKMDGSSVSVANIRGDILPLIRSGYLAQDSIYEQHHMFALWVYNNMELFEDIPEDSRLCGEWLAQAHGTRYDLKDRYPFVAFDFIQGQHDRLPYDRVINYCKQHGGPAYAPVLGIHLDGTGFSIKEALDLLDTTGFYGEIDIAEGCVWRWERFGCSTDFKHKPIQLAKYIRPEKKIGFYLGDTIDGRLVDKKEPVWNWRG